MEVILRIHRQLNICQKDAGMYKLEHIHDCVVLMSGLDITACVALENATDCPNRVSVTFSLLVSRVGREITVRFKCLMHTLIETKSIGFVRLCPTVSGRKDISAGGIRCTPCDKGGATIGITHLRSHVSLGKTLWLYLDRFATCSTSQLSVLPVPEKSNSKVLLIQRRSSEFQLS
jgi:hypothetical protein